MPWRCRLVSAYNKQMITVTSAWLPTSSHIWLQIQCRKRGCCKFSVQSFLRKYKAIHRTVCTVNHPQIEGSFNPIIIHRTIAKLSTCRGRPISITWPVQNGPVSELRPRPKARWWQWKSLLWNIMGKMIGNYEKLREMMGDDVFVEWQLWEIFGQWASMGLMRWMWVHSMFRPNHIEGYQVGDGSKLLCQSPEIILKWPFLEVHWYLMVPKIVNPQLISNMPVPPWRRNRLSKSPKGLLRKWLTRPF